MRIISYKTALSAILLASASLGCWFLHPATQADWEQYDKTRFESSVKTEGTYICEVHHVPFVMLPVNDYAGLPVNDRRLEPYIRAKNKKFPNSYLIVESGACMGGDVTFDALACPLCRRAELKWRARHGYFIPEKH